jgi:hypothetical protein
VHALIVALAFVALLPTGARAASDWDPNEPTRRLDMRWLGAYRETDGQLRVTISFYHPVRLRWFDRLEELELSSMVVLLAGEAGGQPTWFAVFGKRENRLWMQLCESGSGCIEEARVTRPDRFTIRARFGTVPDGVAFRGRSTRGGWDGEILDRTAWGIVT